jgi:integrase
MPRLHHALDDMQLRRWIAAKEPITRADGDGLTFTLSEFGTATWVLRYSRGPRRRELTLGNYPDMTLSEARKQARAQRVLIDGGKDPAAEKKTSKARTQDSMTVSQLCDDFVKKRFPHLAESSVTVYRGLMEGVIRPRLGSLEVSTIISADLVSMIEICKRPWTVCDTLLVLCRTLFAHAIGRKQINANPAIGIDLKAILGPRPPKRKRVMLQKDELEKLLPNIDEVIGRPNGLMFRVLLATCVRTGELATARKSLIDLKRGSWRVLGGSTKTKQEFLVPLAPMVIGWIEELIAMSGDSEWLCPARTSQNKRGHVNKQVLWNIFNEAFKNRKLEMRRFTPHDTRSTAKGHLRNLGFSREISEIALNHKLPGIEGVYDVREEIPERRAAMEAWAHFIEDCCRGGAPTPSESSNVVKFKLRRVA